MSIGYLVIEGNIGAGKTTLATMLSADLNGKLILEGFSDNPFLPKFYSDPAKIFISTRALLFGGALFAVKK